MLFRSAADRHLIYRHRHAVYARELGQHHQNDAGQLTDALDARNIYICVWAGATLAGFVSITPPGGPLSIDKYVKRDDLPCAIDDRTHEVRLLTVMPDARRRELAMLLMYGALRYIEARGGTRVVAIGLLLASRGVGALIGPFVGRAALGPGEKRLFVAIAVALGVFGVRYALLGAAPGLLLAMPAVALAHVGGGAQWTLSSYGLQKIVPDRIRGRVFAFDGMLVTLTFGVSSLLTGWLAAAIGAPHTAYAMGGIAIAWAAVWTATTTRVRRLGLD